MTDRFRGPYINDSSNIGRTAPEGNYQISELSNSSKNVFCCATSQPGNDADDRKKTAAQASQAEILFAMIAIKIVNADIPHREAAARPH
jgi:hypothetical protein